MAKTKATTKTTKKSEKKNQDEPMTLSPEQKKALKLVEKSAKVRDDIERVVWIAMAKAVQKCLKDHGITLTPAAANDLTAIWFGDE